MLEVVNENKKTILIDIGLKKKEFGDLNAYDKRTKLIIDISSLFDVYSIGGGFDKAYDKVNSFKKIDYNSISSFQVIDGILICHYLNSKVDFFNLTIENDELAQKTITRLKEERNKVSSSTSKQLEIAKIDIDKESIIGGAIVLSYTASMRAGNYFIDNIVIRGLNGKFKTINFSEGGINIGNKQALKGEVFKLLESKGFIYNASTESFFSIDEIKISTGEINQELNKLKYKDYSNLKIKNGEQPLTEVEFNGAKQGITKEMKSLNIKSNIKEVQGLLGKWGFGGLIMHSIFMPVFFRFFHSNSSDLASMGKSLSEMALFMGGAKLGSLLPGNIITKSILGLSGGIGSIILGENIADYFQADKKFWLNFPDREDFWEKIGWSGKSFLTHSLTFGTMNDLVDKLGFDIEVPNPWIPLKFITTKIDFNTNPLEYMQSAVGRNSDFWNKRVDKFSSKLDIKIYNLLVNYKNGTGNFSVSSMTTLSDIFIDKASFGKYKSGITNNKYQLKYARERLLKEKLQETLTGHGDYKGFGVIQSELYTHIIEIATNENILLKRNNISFVVKNEINKMKIDSIFLENKQKKINIMKKNIELLLGIYNGNGNIENLSFTLKYSSLINNPGNRGLIIKIYSRILNKEKLNGGQEFKDLINGENGDIFVQLLNYMVEYKRQIKFLSNLKTTGYAVKWGF